MSTQTPVTNNGYGMSTDNTNMQPGNPGLNRTVAGGDKRRAQAGKGDDTFSVQTSPLHVLQPQPDYARHPAYTDVIGDVLIRMRLGRKAGEIGSVHDEYVPGNAAGVCLVIGEYENDGFLMEESDDGTRVAGIWEGAIDGHGIMRDMWTDIAHDGYTLPFMLRPVAVIVTSPYDVAANSSTATPTMPMTPLVPTGPG